MGIPTTLFSFFSSSSFHSDRLSVLLLCLCFCPSRVHSLSTASAVARMRGARNYDYGNVNHDQFGQFDYYSTLSSLSSSSSPALADAVDTFGWRFQEKLVDFGEDSDSGIRQSEIGDILREKLVLKFPRIFRKRSGGGGGGGGSDDGGGSVGGSGGKSNFSLELVRLTYLPMVFSGGVRQRVALSAQRLHVGSRIDFNVSSSVDREKTCLGVDGCVYDRLVSFAFDDTRSPIRWPSQLRAAFNPLSVFPSDSRLVKVQLCANREAWRMWQGYVPCVSAQLEPWFWTSLANKSEWNEALNCRHRENDYAENNNNAGGDHFCCICAPDVGDGAAICDDSMDIGAHVRHFATSAKCARDRRLGPRGTFGACPYKCACGRADVMRSRCGLRLKEEMTESWSTELLAQLKREDDAYRDLLHSAAVAASSSSTSSGVAWAQSRIHNGGFVGRIGRPLLVIFIVVVAIVF